MAENDLERKLSEDELFYISHLKEFSLAQLKPSLLGIDNGTLTAIDKDFGFYHSDFYWIKGKCDLIKKYCQTIIPFTFDPCARCGIYMNYKRENHVEIK